MNDAHHDVIEAVRQRCSAAYTEPKIKGRAVSVRPSPAHHQLAGGGRHLHQHALLSPGSTARIPHVPNSTCIYSLYYTFPARKKNVQIYIYLNVNTE